MMSISNNVGNGNSELFSDSDSPISNMIIDVSIHNNAEMAMGWDDFPAILDANTDITINPYNSYSYKFSSSEHGRQRHNQPYSEIDFSTMPASSPLKSSNIHDEVSSTCTHSITSIAAQSSSCLERIRLGFDWDLPSTMIQNLKRTSSSCSSFPSLSVSHVWNATNTDVPDFVDTSDDDDSDQLSELDCCSICDDDLEVMDSCTISATPAAATSENKRRVHFSEVHVREYDITLGDHPLAGAYPLSLDWTYSDDKHSPYDIEEYYQKQLMCYQRHESDENDDVPSSSRIFGKPRHIEVMERRERLADALGISYEKLDVMERQRRNVSNDR